MILDGPFGLALLWIGVFWLVYLGGVRSAKSWGTFDPVEAKAKAIFTSNLSLALLAFWLHWTAACLFFLNAFVMYFWAQRFFARRR